MAGKGDKRRPRAPHVSREQYEQNHDLAFRTGVEQPKPTTKREKIDRRRMCP